ncbi:DUF2927 domain-containing protein [Antarcticimicrobium sediminis]|uniref:DUF2927 domain-containing protein n=1 Tax=Antarcticimicrobium sediminis TaxID=2546227 RepID=A0A4R5EPU5_9RHOB|nr:DUF2927 domain-containing protein [Antarcticimicrobium sediminis]TDE36761.1 DUF2927 domain-containing protein [Antarcticimicrobium sediminis]
MRGLRHISHRAGVVLAGLVLAGPLLLSGCDETGPRSSPLPQARPAALVPQTPVPRTGESRDLARYYRIVQNDLLTRGLLRTDGGGPDTPFSADDLVRDFETIAFFDEYSRGTTTARRTRGSEGELSRWSAPVRIGVEFGASVQPAQRTRDANDITGYANRLAKITGHPISVLRDAGPGANFQVFVAGEDDRAYFQTRLKQLIPSISAEELALFRNLPRSFYCLVIAVSGSRTPNTYTRAVALIRAEHPDLVRLSCIHEELAQGLGLPNDSPEARPSIFNDDDEFALLTNHDELLLKMLYDPRLRPGMTASEARPVTRIIARELMGQSL